MATNTLTFDCLVIGSGMAGFSAATALHQAGKRVAVVSESVGATAVSSGAWDFGPLPNHGGFSLEELTYTVNWREKFSSLLVDGIETLQADEVSRMAAELTQLLGTDLDLRFSFRNPMLLPTSSGRWRRAFGAQGIQANADMSRLKEKRIGVVQSHHWRFPSELIARSWKQEAARLGIDLQTTEMDIHLNGADWTLPQLATRLAHDPAMRERFTELLQQALKEKPVDLLLFPPLFLHLPFAAEMGATLGVEIAECLATTEPIPGERLRAALGRGLERLDIPAFTGSQVTPSLGNEGLTGVRYLQDGDWSSLKAKQVILATGKFFGGGVNLGMERISETVFNLPLFYSRAAGPIQWRRQLPWSPRPFPEAQWWAKLGVWTNRYWQPLNEEGQPAYPNLRACGSILGGVDFPRASLGLGFMSYSGRQCAALVE